MRKNQSNKSRLERNNEAPVLWLILILPLQVGLWNQFSGLSAASWAARNFAQVSAYFLFHPPVKPGFLLPVPPCSSSLLICRFSAPWSLLVTIVCSLFLTASLPKVPAHASLQEDLVTAQGWSAPQRLPLLLHFFQNGLSHIHWKQAIETPWNGSS